MLVSVLDSTLVSAPHKQEFRSSLQIFPGSISLLSKDMDRYLRVYQRGSNHDNPENDVSASTVSEAIHNVVIATLRSRSSGNYRPSCYVQTKEVWKLVHILSSRLPRVTTCLGRLRELT